MEFPIGLFTVFAAGVVTFLSPCVLPLVPAYLSYVVGESVDELKRSRRPRLAAMGVYAAGLGCVPFLLAAAFTTSFIARLRAFGRLGRALHLTAGLVLIVVGIAMITGHLTALGDIG